MSSFDAEFNSASNGDTFIHGKNFGKNFTWIFFSPIYIYIRVHIWCSSENFSLQNEFPFMELSSFDAEFNSASNGDTFSNGKRLIKIPLQSFFSPLHVYVSIYDVQERTYLFRNNSHPWKWVHSIQNLILHRMNSFPRTGITFYKTHFFVVLAPWC
jgi:hypothetical protein